MKKEFDIEDEWVSLEIHPETPPQGIPVLEKFGRDSEGMFKYIKNAGVPFGIKFGDLRLLSNSRMALEASEYARDNGKFNEFNEKVFHAYFVETKDIGDLKVILDIAEEAGIDSGELEIVLTNHKFAHRLNEAADKSEKYEVNSTPTFIINNRYKIVGAQPIDSFRKALKNIKSE